MPPSAGNDLVPRAQHDAEVALAAERAARATTERFLSSAPRPAPAPAPPPEPDALAEFVDKTKLPPEQAALLDRAIGQRIRGMVGPVLGKMGAAINEKDNAKAYQEAFDRVMDMNPDMAQNPQKFAAASAAAELELRSENRGFTPGEYLRRAAMKYRELFPVPGQRGNRAPAPPYVEGASDLSAGGMVPGSRRTAGPGDGEEPKPVNPFEEWYPDNDEEIIDLKGRDANEIFKTMTEDYQKNKNEFLEDKGMRSFMPRVAVPLLRRRRARIKAEREKAKAAAAAGR